MIRLTATLVVCIFVTMAVAGRDPAVLRDGTGDGVEVTRLESADDTALLQVGDGLERDALSIPLDNEKAAVQAALAATAAKDAPAPQPARHQALSTAPAPAADAWYVTGNRVNLRAGPSTGTAVIGQATIGQEAQVLEEVDGWYRIETSNDGTIGYIYGKFLSQTRPL